MAEINHALASPSYLKQICMCEKSLPSDPLALNETNDAAEKGTIQHAYLNYLLADYFNLTKEEVDYSTLTIDEVEEVQEVFIRAVEEYKTLKKKYARVDVLLEQKVDLNNYIPDSFGFVDISYVGHTSKPNKATGLYKDTTIYVLDAKFGRLQVEIQDDKGLNPQLTAYFCGVYDSIKDKYQVTKGHLMILQPKLNHYPKFSGRASTILNHMTTYIAPAAIRAINGEGTYNPSPKNCLWCKNSKHCKFYHILSLAKLQMLEQPDMLSDEFIEENILPHITNLKKYLDNIQDYALKKAQLGKLWKGFKLGTSRPTRVFEDEEKIKSLGIEGLVVETLLSPYQAEKLLGKSKFNELLGAYVTYKPGKETLVVDTPQNKKSDFKKEK